MTEHVSDAFQQMDAMYRYQRYFYDVTRKYYLLGRDRLIERMEIRDGETIAEIGCGTGRNLEILAGRYPKARFFGLDASSEMLITAQAKIDAAGIKNITFANELADNLDHSKTFGLDAPLDGIFFSYSISMIPTWRASIKQALANLKPGGTLFIVDFYDQLGLPSWFRTLLKSWLRRFHVQFWNDLIPFLHELDSSGQGTLSIESITRRYAFIAIFRKRP